MSIIVVCKSIFGFSLFVLLFCKMNNFLESGMLNGLFISARQLIFMWINALIGNNNKITQLPVSFAYKVIFKLRYFAKKTINVCLDMRIL